MKYQWPDFPVNDATSPSVRFFTIDGRPIYFSCPGTFSIEPKPSPDAVEKRV
jgi:hypothetical protein